MPLERVYLLADMHLKPMDAPDAHARRLARRDAERLEEFLAHITRTDETPATLILLGDTFNFWLERKSRYIGDYSAVLGLFKEAADKGLVIHHVSGNRDFIIGEGLGFDPISQYPGFIKYRGGFTVSRLVDFGIEVHGARYRFHQGGKTVTCLHGDSLCTRDLPFMCLRWALQGPVGRTFFKYSPWGFLKWLIRRQQARTGVRAARKAPEAILNQSAVRREMAMGADLLVCGHIHSAHERSFSVNDRECKFVVLPAWMDGGYGVVENGEVRVEQFFI